jgi:hypothetical protein
MGNAHILTSDAHANYRTHAERQQLNAHVLSSAPPHPPEASFRPLVPLSQASARRASAARGRLSPEAAAA